MVSCRHVEVHHASPDGGRISPTRNGSCRPGRVSHGHRYLRLADELASVFRDDAIVALFPMHAQPAMSPWRLALVTILPCAEGLGDRQAADAVRSHIDWKYGLRLELTAQGFDASGLSEFRTRLMAGTAASLMCDTLFTWCRDRPMVNAGGRQRTDSTPMLATVRALGLEGPPCPAGRG
jgi:transposase